MQNHKIKSKIVFNKERSISGIINDTFDFLKQNFKDLFIKTWKIVLPYFLILILGSVYYSYSFNRVRINAGSILNMEGDISYFISYFMHVFILIVFISIVQLVVLNYIKDYINGEISSSQELKAKVYQRFFSLIGLNVLIYLLVLVGGVFLIIPGIYLFVVLVVAPFIFVFQNVNVKESISKSFDLVKGRWWSVFSSLFILFLVFLAFSLFFNVFIYLNRVIESFTYEKNVVGAVNSVFDTPINLLLYIISLALYSIIYYILVIHIFLWEF
jgi:hypothetical protein